MVDAIENKKIERIMGYFDANKVPIPKKFFNLLQSKEYASDLCKELAKKAGDTMEILMANSFIEGGLTNDVKEKISGLAETWAMLIEDKAKLKVAKIEKEIDYYYVVPKGRENMDIRDVVLKYVDETIEGINIIIQDKNAHLDPNVLSSALTKLEKLRGIVIACIDVKSKTANDIAWKIVGEDENSGLHGYRLSANNRLITKANEKILDSAILEASKWAEIVKYPDKKDRIKDNDAIFYKEDQFSVIVKMKPLEEESSQFFSLINQRKKESEEVDNLADEVKNLKIRIQDIEKEIEEWDNKVDNGVCTIVAADVEIEKLEEEKEDIKREIKTKSMFLSSIKGQFKFAKRIMDNYGMLKTFYDFFRTQAPAYFYDMFSHIDFNKFLQILNSPPKQDSMNIIDNMLYAAKKTVLDRSEALKGFVDGLDELLEDEEKIENEQGTTIKEGENVINEAEARRKKRQEERAARSGSTSPKETPKTENNALKDIISIRPNDN